MRKKTNYTADMVMSSKRAGALVGRDLLYHALHLIATGKLGNLPPSRLYSLKRRGFIDGRGNMYRLLPKGEKALSEREIWDLEIPTPKHWDRKWRLVLFDIPKDKRKRRDAFRLRLKEMNLALYQNSVWIYPYPLEKTVNKVAEFYKLSGCVSFIVAERISNEALFRKHYRLK